MSLDWDALVLKPAMGIFGASVPFARPGGASFDLADAVFDRAHETVEFADGAPISTRAPQLGVRAAAFPPGFTPAEGDQVTCEWTLYVVTDVRPDGKGGLVLRLALADEEG